MENLNKEKITEKSIMIMVSASHGPMCCLHEYTDWFWSIDLKELAKIIKNIVVNRELAYYNMEYDDNSFELTFEENMKLIKNHSELEMNITIQNIEKLICKLEKSNSYIELSLLCYELESEVRNISDWFELYSFASPFDTRKVLREYDVDFDINDLKSCFEDASL